MLRRHFLLSAAAGRNYLVYWGTYTAGGPRYGTGESKGIYVSRLNTATGQYGNLYGNLLDYVISAALIFYILTIAGVFRLRATRLDAPRPYRAFGYPIVPALYVLLCGIVMVDLLIVRPEYTWPGLIIVLTGIPVYFAWRWTSRRASA